MALCVGGGGKEREKRIDYGGGVNFHFIMSQRRCTYYHSAHTGTEKGHVQNRLGGTVHSQEEFNENLIIGVQTLSW